jgi:predicted ester cyclase
MTTDPAKLAEFDEILRKWNENFKIKQANLKCPHASEHDSWFELVDLKYDGWSSFTYHVKACCSAFETLILQAATEERMFNPPHFDTGETVVKYATETDRRDLIIEQNKEHAAKSSHPHAAVNEIHEIHAGGHGVCDETRSCVECWFEEVWGEHDITRIRDLVSDTCKVHGADGSIKSGPEAFEERYTALHEAMPDIHVEVKYHIVEHDKAASLLLITGTPKGESKRLEFTAMTFSRWRDGKIREAWSLADLDDSILKAKEATAH